jgi:hypothetical protein
VPVDNLKGLASLRSTHPFLKKAVFLTMHLLFGSATMGIAVSLLWRYWWAHISFMVTLGVLSCWNARPPCTTDRRSSWSAGPRPSDLKFTLKR